MAVKLSNNATSTLASNILAADTSLSVRSADAERFPALSGSDWFPLTVVDGSGNMEIMRCTARTGAVMTVTRGQEGTTAIDFSSGSRVDLRLTAAAANNDPADLLSDIKTVDGTGSGLDADLLDGQEGAYYTDILARLGYTPIPIAGGTFTGRVGFTGNKHGNNPIGVSTDTLGELEVRGNGTGAAAIAFHRPSAFAAYLGVDTDNQLKYGGWTLGANSYKIWHSGNHGAGSGLDADVLDGYQASAFMKLSGNQTITADNTIFTSTYAGLDLKATDPSGFAYMDLTSGGRSRDYDWRLQSSPVDGYFEAIWADGNLKFRVDSGGNIWGAAYGGNIQDWILANSVNLGAEQVTSYGGSTTYGDRIMVALAQVPANCVVTRAAYDGGTGVVHVYYRSIT